MLGHPAYSITCLLDHTAMVTVHTDKYGVFDCKPLQVRGAGGEEEGGREGGREGRGGCKYQPKLNQTK